MPGDLHGSCRIVNIKQGRVGCLGPSKEIHDLAGRHGLTCWVGQMIESGVAISYGLALASLENCRHYNDTLPVSVYAADDIIDPPLILNPDSMVDVPRGAGLGVAVDEEKLQRCSIARKVFRA